VIDNNQGDSILATGFSCRSQVKRFAGFKPKHPIELLAQVL
jgi:Fe-S oxidoreductase